MSFTFPISILTIRDKSPEYRKYNALKLQTNKLYVRPRSEDGSYEWLGYY